MSCPRYNSEENFTILLQNTYLPTMSEDTLPEARRVLGGRFMVSFHPGYTSDKILVQTIIGLFMIVAMVFCIPECPGATPTWWEM